MRGPTCHRRSRAAAGASPVRLGSRPRGGAAIDLDPHATADSSASTQSRLQRRARPGRGGTAPRRRDPVAISPRGEPSSSNFGPATGVVDHPQRALRRHASPRWRSAWRRSATPSSPPPLKTTSRPLRAAYRGDRPATAHRRRAERQWRPRRTSAATADAAARLRMAGRRIHRLGRMAIVRACRRLVDARRHGSNGRNDQRRTLTTVTRTFRTIGDRLCGHPATDCAAGRPRRRLAFMRIGAHVDATDPLAAAAAAQGRSRCSSSSPTRRAGRRPSHAPTRPSLRAAEVDVYIHAPYVINVATLNNRIRIPSRKLLLGHADGGRRGRRQGPDRPRWTRQRGRRPATGFDNWRKTFAYAEETRRLRAHRC